VHLRALVTNRKDPLTVVSDLVEEAITSADGIGSTLAGEAKEAWIRFKLGYITFHVSQERYRLSDLGLPRLTTPIAIATSLNQGFLKCLSSVRSRIILYQESCLRSSERMAKKFGSGLWLAVSECHRPPAEAALPEYRAV